MPAYMDYCPFHRHIGLTLLSIHKIKFTILHTVCCNPAPGFVPHLAVTAVDSHIHLVQPFLNWPLLFLIYLFSKWIQSTNFHLCPVSATFARHKNELFLVQSSIFAPSFLTDIDWDDAYPRGFHSFEKTLIPKTQDSAICCATVPFSKYQMNWDYHILIQLALFKAVGFCFLSIRAMFESVYWFSLFYLCPFAIRS